MIEKRNACVTTLEKRIYVGVILLMTLVCAAALVSVAPIQTQDGPVHITFGNVLALDRGSNPLLFEHYQANDTLNPNSTVYVLVAALMEAFPPPVVESVVQLLCTLGLVGSAWFALRQSGAATNATWLTLLVFPLALNRLLFFGTYNFCLSAAAFLLSVGAFFRLQARATVWRGLAVAAALYFAFFAHGAGFVAAVVAVLALAVAQAGTALAAGQSWRTVSRAQLTNALVLAAPLPLVLLALRANPNAAVEYGVPLGRRIVDLALLEGLRLHAGIGKQLATLLLNPILFGGACVLAVKLWRARYPSRPQETARAVGALTVLGALLLLALTFPDTFGGGWIHFQRLALFPSLAAVLCLAYYPFSKLGRAAVASAGVAVTVTLLANAMTAQREIARQMLPLAEIDRIVGSHCSVLPLVLSLKPLDGRDRPVDLGYNPYVHVATRLEYAHDRVSLYNYQARTALYPVRFRDGHDTQNLIFHWAAMRRTLGIDTVDIERFEASAGMPIDYILQWGPLSAAAPKLEGQVLKAERGARKVYESPDGRVVLFRRPAHAHSRCSSGAGTTAEHAQVR